MPDPINVVIDISHHNVKVDLAAAKADGIVAVIHKATQGIKITDDHYDINRKKAADAGLLWGAYHFGSGAGDGVAQAKHFLDVAKPDAKTLVVLDFEENKGSPMTLDDAHEFVTYIRKTLKRYPVLYAGNYLKVMLGKKADPLLAKCPLWYAQYSGTAPHIPPIWKKWTMWQYTDGVHGAEPHSVKGIGPCDRDKFNGDLQALQKLWGV